MNEITHFNATGDATDAETMPHSIEAEQQLLGAILTNNDVYDRVAAIIGPSISMIPCMRGSLKSPRRGLPKTIWPRPSR